MITSDSDEDVMNIRDAIAVNRAVAKAMGKLALYSLAAMLACFFAVTFYEKRLSVWVSRFGLLLRFAALMFLATSFQRFWIEVQSGRKLKKDLAELLSDRYGVNSNSTNG